LAPPTTTLYTYFVHDNSQPRSVSSDDITLLLRQAAALVESKTGIPPSNISAQSLRSGGATALMCARVDNQVIQLMGRWRSDTMLEYLRTQAFHSNGHFSEKMVEHGAYSFQAPTDADDDTDPADSLGNLFPDNLPLDLLRAHATCELQALGLA
jgi:hypothetical protein